MRSGWGAVAAVVCLLTGCTGTAPDPDEAPASAAGSAGSVTATTTLPQSPMPTVSPSPTVSSSPTVSPSPSEAVVTATVTANPTKSSSARPTAAPPVTRADCPLTAATLSTLLGVRVQQVGIGPPAALEEPPGVRAAGCSFAGDRPGACVRFTTGFGRNGDKLWAYVPTTCAGIGGKPAAIGASVRNCVVNGAIFRSVVRRNGSVVWAEFPVLEGAPPPVAARYRAVVLALRA